MILLTIFIGASAWLIKKAWPIAANTGQSRSIFVDNITKENLIDKLIRINRGFSNALPGIFIGLGILGTFVGLTFGLREIDFGSTNPIRQSMKQLLDVMLIAFSTSVWGITLSICFSSLEKWMENKLETEILHLQEDINKLFSSKPLEVYLKDLLEASWEQSRVLKSFSTDLEGPAKGGLGGVVNQDIASAVNRLTEAVEALNDSKQESTAEAVNRMVEQFNEQLMGAAGTQFDRLAQVVADIPEALNHVSDEFQARLAQMAESSTRAVDIILEQTQVWRQNLENRSNEIANQRPVELNEILTVMREAQAVIAESKCSAQQSQQLTAGMQQMVEKLQTVTEGFAQIAGEIRQTHEVYGEPTDYIATTRDSRWSNRLPLRKGQ